MLEKLLAEIRSSGTTHPAVLASRLNISLGMVQAMLADLERMGYLQSIDVCQQTACSHCSFSDLCAPGGGSKMWVLK
ncbi:MAG: hypothetical protein B6D39_06175 [Anaerolineae bacterium UTCFX2]|jgi:ribosomal protein S25|nr:winged helix-turn-helix domain-containing protein [Anaerolineae bacterium]MCZ7553736.1 winged helix-turn-helix domain-containing protein [Anaerolineales bacterium]OQY91696.1 MAG: hypothetical protein B6D39_06175 [Anaerolineae bacterium UTCFX2]